MSIIHVQQIKAAVVALFGSAIDVSDRTNATPHDQDTAQITRCLAAFIPYHFGNAEVNDAAASVIDGTNDNGIDSIFFDQ